MLFYKNLEKVEIVKCNLKCEQKQWTKFHHFYLPKLAFDLEKSVCSLLAQLKDKFRFVWSYCGVETVLDGERYMINMCNKYSFL